MEYVYKFYCKLHKLAKIFVGKYIGSNDIPTKSHVLKSFGIADFNADDTWLSFISNSTINSNDTFNGMHYAGFISETNDWCLPSWIWTNATLVALFSTLKKENSLRIVSDNLLKRQLKCGGWIVRNDYGKNGAKPILAPNDSAYIANNGMLEAYIYTGEYKYLESAEKCAKWIIETSRSDGMVYLGFDLNKNEWDKSCVIVDVGFTAGLFARLYEITQKTSYIDFLKRFIYRYIDLFFVPSKNGFCTNIDFNNKQNNSMFGRGQAWALEGLIPSFKVLKDEKIRNVIQSTIDNLIDKQCRNGGWPYNLVCRLMGEDCKAVPVIAKDMMDWYEITKDKKIKESATRALKWCMKHTSNEGASCGGIFSFCLEGAIVHNLYSSCAFVYSSAYAIMLNNRLKNK